MSAELAHSLREEAYRDLRLDPPERDECPHHAGQPADDCEDCAERGRCSICGGTQLIRVETSGPYALLFPCQCDEAATSVRPPIPHNIAAE